MVEIKNSLDNDIYTIHVIGEVDASSSIYLDESISEATTKHNKIMVNCQQLDYISSAGLGVFMSYINDMEEKGIKLVIYGLSDKVRHVFQILGLDQLLKITNNEGEAKQIIDEV
jgi:anti-sigma B factor antagonist